MADAQGNFKIPSLASNLTFKVVCAARGFEPVTLKKIDPLTSPLNVQLHPRGTEQLPADRTIFGRVLDPQHRPVAGAVISLDGIAIGERTRWGLDTNVDSYAVSDATGQFEISSSQRFDAAGVLIEAPGLARTKFKRVASGARRDFVLPVGAALMGRVVREGRPVRGINVGVASVNRGVDEFTGDFVVGTDENGDFVFPNLPINRDYQFYGLMDPLRGIGALPARVVRVGADGSKTDLGKLALDSGWRISGRVSMKEGRAVPPDARLVLFRDNAWNFSITDLPPDGSFDLPNIPGESLRLDAYLTGYHSTQVPKLGKLTNNVLGLEIVLEPGEKK